MVYQTRLIRPDRDWMLFVDGENLSKRGAEALRANGIKPYEGPYWRRDVFLWLPGSQATYPFFVQQPFRGFSRPLNDATPLPPGPRPAQRAYYYTSTVSDEPEWTQTRLALRDLGFEPCLFKRTQGKSKAVDISLATDLLTLGGEDQYDVAVIVAGDGDYLPLLSAVKRRGHHVVVCFFAEYGLNNELRIAADDFVDLTPHFVEHWTAHLQTREQEAAKAEAERAKGASST
ncbi:MAG: NYN domain-containing protein [Candidatus Limnocylindrales bacterium]|jgi:hypothetical protein